MPFSPAVLKVPKPPIAHFIVSSVMIIDASSQLSSVGVSTESHPRLDDNQVNKTHLLRSLNFSIY
jgi:hypothetical protein